MKSLVFFFLFPFSFFLPFFSFPISFFWSHFLPLAAQTWSLTVKPNPGLCIQVDIVQRQPAKRKTNHKSASLIHQSWQIETGAGRDMRIILEAASWNGPAHADQTNS